MAVEGIICGVFIQFDTQTMNRLNHIFVSFIDYPINPSSATSRLDLVLLFDFYT